MKWFYHSRMGMAIKSSPHGVLEKPKQRMNDKPVGAKTGAKIKISWETVCEIRRLREQEKYPYSLIASLTKCNVHSVEHICNYITRLCR